MGHFIFFQENKWSRSTLMLGNNFGVVSFCIGTNNWENLRAYKEKEM
jgi:hypothetical protein